MSRAGSGERPRRGPAAVHSSPGHGGWRERFTQRLQRQGRLGAWQEVYGAQLRLAEARLKADAVLCTAALHGLGGRWRQVTQLAQELQRQNVVTLNAWLKSGAWNYALVLMGRMPCMRLDPDVVSYNTAA